MLFVCLFHDILLYLCGSLDFELKHIYIAQHNNTNNTNNIVNKLNRMVYI